MDPRQYSPNGRILAHLNEGRPSISTTSRRALDSQHHGSAAAIDIPLVSEPEESEEHIAGNSNLTQNPPISSVAPDEGYLRKGWRRVLDGTGKSAKWCYTDAPEDEPNPRLLDHPPGDEIKAELQDLYKSKETFPDGMAFLLRLAIHPDHVLDVTTVQVCERACIGLKNL